MRCLLQDCELSGIWHVKLINFLVHRVILTRDDVEVKTAAIDLVKQVVRAAKEVIDCDRHRTKGVYVCEM